MIIRARLAMEEQTTKYGGIDLGGTKIQTVIVDSEYNVLGSARQATPATGDPTGVAKVMEKTLRAAAAEAKVEVSSLAGVGVGSPGTITDGSVSGAHNLPGWEGTFPLATTLEKAFGCPVKLGNDVDVATLAEFELGAGKPYSSLLGVFWGTGVGGGIILDGKHWTGRGSAAEIGHVIVEMDGALCACGRRGCMEAYAGRTAMEEYFLKLVRKGGKTGVLKTMKKRGQERMTSGVWFRALKQNDKLAVQTIDRAIQALATAIASSVNLLDVEAVIIGGGLGVRLGQPYIDKIIAAMKPNLFATSRPLDVRVASLGDLGGALGGVVLVRKDVREAGQL